MARIVVQDVVADETIPVVDLEAAYCASLAEPPGCATITQVKMEGASTTRRRRLASHADEIIVDLTLCFAGQCEYVFAVKMITLECESSDVMYCLLEKASEAEAIAVQCSNVTVAANNTICNVIAAGVEFNITRTLARLDPAFTLSPSFWPTSKKPQIHDDKTWRQNLFILGGVVAGLFLFAAMRKCCAKKPARRPMWRAAPARQLVPAAWVNDELIAAQRFAATPLRMPIYFTRRSATREKEKNG